MKNINLAEYKNKHLHFVGAGGCSMSGLALICSKLDEMGFKITGSDKNMSPFVAELQKADIPVSIGHDEKNAANADLIIYSAAIKPDNVERVYAQQNNIPQIERSDFLGAISHLFDEVIAIAGCHGKTTITSMLAKILIQANLEPNVHVGGYVDFLNGGVALGSSNLFVTEACEYVDSYLSIEPTCILLNNIDDDHLDYFADINAIVNSFKKFVSKLSSDQLLVGNIEDENVAKILESFSGRVVTYGFNNGDYQAQNIKTQNGKTSFDCVLNGKKLFTVNLSVPGNHNAINALAAIIIAKEYGADDNSILTALADYTLTKRRFEYYGTKNGVSYYHDYAHHPNEIKACLQGARSVAQNKLYVVFQCNSYTRAKTLFCENVDCFNIADKVFVPDIYPGRETDTGIVHAKDMVNGINKADNDKAKYIPTFEEINNYLDEIIEPGDLVVTLGSGDVYIQTNKLLV